MSPVARGAKHDGAAPADCRARHARAMRPQFPAQRTVNGSQIFPRSGEPNFPGWFRGRLRLRRHCRVGICLWRPTAAFGQHTWLGAAWYDRRQQFGVLAHTIAEAFEVHDHGVVKQPVQQIRGNVGSPNTWPLGGSTAWRRSGPAPGCTSEQISANRRCSCRRSRTPGGLTFFLKGRCVVLVTNYAVRRRKGLIKMASFASVLC